MLRGEDSVEKNIAVSISLGEDAETATGVANTFFPERTTGSRNTHGFHDVTKTCARATRSVQFTTVR